MAATIFNGNFIKTLKSNLRLGVNIELITDQTNDPSSVAFSAPIGSLYFRKNTNEVYKKQDNGSSTNWLNMGSLSETLAYIGTITKDPTGFPNSTETTLSVNNGTRTLTVARTGASFTVWQKGTPYTFSSDQSIVFPDTEGMHHFYIDNGVLTSTTTFTPDIIKEYVYVANLYWDATNNVAILGVDDERHGMYMDGATHAYLHNAFGSQYVSGLGLTSFTADGDGSTAAQAQFTCSSGVFYDEDIILNLSTITAGTSGIPIIYLEGASALWRATTPNGYFVRTAGTGRAAYNQFTGGAWQQTEVVNGDYVLAHIFASNSLLYPFVCVQGQSSYTTLNNARTGADTEINSLVLGALPFQEYIPVGTIIFQTSNTYTNAVKSRVRTTASGLSYVDWRTQNLSAGTAPTDHGNLSGLQDDDHNTLYQRNMSLQSNSGASVSVTTAGTRNTEYQGDTSSNDVTYNLDAIAGFLNGTVLGFGKIGSNTNKLVVDPNGGELIGTETTKELFYEGDMLWMTKAGSDTRWTVLSKVLRVARGEYRTATAGSYTSKGTAIKIDTATRSHGSYNTTTGQWTCQRTGTLNMSGMLTTVMPAGTYNAIYLYKNGAESKVLSTDPVLTGYCYSQFSTSVEMTKGDTCELRIEHDRGSAIALYADAKYNHVEFEWYAND